MNRQIKQAQGVEEIGTLVGEWLAVKGLGKVQEIIHSKQQEAKSGETSYSEIDRERFFSELASQLKSLGAKDARLTNGESLFNYLGATDGSRGIMRSKKQFYELIQLLTQTARKLSPLKSLDPNLADDLIKYTFELLKQNAYDSSLAIEQLKDLSQRNLLFYDAYIISQLKSYKVFSSDPQEAAEGQMQAANSMALALIGSLVENKGEVNENTKEVMDQVGKVVNTMFGTKSTELLNSITFTDKQGKAAFDTLASSRDLWQGQIPIAEKYLQTYSDTVNGLATHYRDKDAMKVWGSVLSPLIWITAVFNGAKSGISGEVIGEATKTQK